jgi:hypothetical protein
MLDHLLHERRIGGQSCFPVGARIHRSPVRPPERGVRAERALEGVQRSRHVPARERQLAFKVRPARLRNLRLPDRGNARRVGGLALPKLINQLIVFATGIAIPLVLVPLAVSSSDFSWKRFRSSKLRPIKILSAGPTPQPRAVPPP